MNRIYLGIFLALLLTTAASCTPKKIASGITAQIMASGAPSFEMESDIEIAKNTSITMLKMIEAFQYDNPKNKTLNTLLARSYANYTQGFLEFEMLKNKDVNDKDYQKYEKRAKNFYRKGKEFGLRALKKNGSFKRALTKDLDTFKKALKSFGRGSVPALFWTAMNWGSWINLNKDSPIAIAEYPKAEAIMERVLKLDENYFYGGPHLFFGFSYGARPKMFGGDPIKSKEHFEKAVTAYNRNFLLALVFYAQIYAVQAQDPGLYESLLSEVISADASKLPEARLANELAKERAEWLLNNKKKFFSLSE
jgi:tetratricopeptide (TPR) repeat protein